MSINESMLLLDEALIDAESGIEREVHPGKKSDFVMEPDRDKPWEYSGPGMSKRIHLYGTTLYDDLMGKYRMWYAGRMGPHWRYEGSNYQIPGLYVPRTDEKPYNYNGVTQDKYGRTFVDTGSNQISAFLPLTAVLTTISSGLFTAPRCLSTVKSRIRTKGTRLSAFVAATGIYFSSRHRTASAGTTRTTSSLSHFVRTRARSM